MTTIQLRCGCTVPAWDFRHDAGACPKSRRTTWPTQRSAPGCRRSSSTWPSASSAPSARSASAGSG